MSQRTIVEFNHDFAHKIDAEATGKVEALLYQAMRSGAREYWELLEPYGIRRIVQCHHADERAVIVNGSAYAVA